LLFYFYCIWGFTPNPTNLFEKRLDQKLWKKFCVVFYFLLPLTSYFLLPLGAPPHTPPTFLKKGWIKNFGKSFVLFFTSSSLPFGVSPQTPPTFLKKGWTKNFGKNGLRF